MNKIAVALLLAVAHAGLPTTKDACLTMCGRKGMSPDDCVEACVSRKNMIHAAVKAAREPSSVIAAAITDPDDINEIHKRRERFGEPVELPEEVIAKTVPTAAQCMSLCTYKGMKMDFCKSACASKGAMIAAIKMLPPSDQAMLMAEIESPSFAKDSEKIVSMMEQQKPEIFKNLPEFK